MLAKLKVLILFALSLWFTFSSLIVSAATSELTNKKQSLASIFKRIDHKLHEAEVSQISVQKNSEALFVENEKQIPNNAVLSESVSQNSYNNTPQDLQVGIPTGEELLLSIYIDKLFLGDIYGFKTQTGAMINLRSLFDILDFPIQINLPERSASGWFIKGNNHFDFYFGEPENNGEAAKVTISGKSEIVQYTSFQIINDELYVEGSLISEWFGLNISYDFSALRMGLTPNESLPIQTSLARQNKNVHSAKTNVATMPWKESPYQEISSPLLDLQMQSSYFTRNDSSFTAYSALGSHDLAYMNTEYYVAGLTDGGLTDARLKFSKELKLGVLPLANIEFGDITAVSINSHFNSGLNRGISFAKTSSEINDNQRININGDIQPGWDIELYQNKILIAKQATIQTGRYEFNNIDLLFGNNNFEIISYGPQGQVNHEYKDVYIDGNALSASEDDYAFSITQQGKSLLGVNDQLTTKNSGVLLAASYSRGLSDWFSVKLGSSYLFQDDSSDVYNTSISANLNVFERLLLNANISIDNDNYITSYLTGRTLLAGQSIFYSFREKQQGIIDSNGIAQKSSAIEHLFSMDGSLLKSGEYSINYNNQIFLRDDINGNETTDIQSLLSLSAGRFSLQHSLFWSKVNSGLESDELLSGALYVQRNLGPVFSRLSVGYSAKPESQIDYVTTQFSWPMFDYLQSELKLDFLPKTDSYKTAFSVFWQNDSFNLSGTFTYDDKGDKTFGLFLRFGFGYDAENEIPFVSSRALARNGAMSVRVFEDLNNDGLYNKDDKVLEGVTVNAVQSHRKATSSSDGIALIKNLPTNRVATDILIDSTTLPDPFLIPSTPGVSITPRKGFLDRIDYPVVTSSEVDGTVFTVNIDGTERIMAYVPINLLDEEGNIVKTTQSEFDGYYLFTGLIPGKYVVSIDGDYLKKHKLENTDGLMIDLTVQGDVINGSDFVLKELEFTNGYAINAGEFDNLSMLKVYWHLIQKRYRAKLKQKVFYSYNESIGKYQLNLGFFQENDSAIKACESVFALSIDCKVDAFEFVEKSKRSK